MTKERNKNELAEPLEVRGHEAPQDMVARENDLALRRGHDVIAEAKHAHLSEANLKDLKEASQEFSEEVKVAGEDLLEDLKNLSKEESLEKLSKLLSEGPGFEEVASGLKEQAPLLTIEIDPTDNMPRALSNAKRLLRILEGEIGAEALKKLPLHISAKGDDVRLMRNGHLRVNVLSQSIKLTAEAVKNSGAVKQILEGSSPKVEIPVQVDTKESLSAEGMELSRSLEADLKDIDPEKARGEVTAIDKEEEAVAPAEPLDKNKPLPAKQNVAEKSVLERDFEDEYDSLMESYPNLGGIYDWRLYGHKFDKLDKLKDILRTIEGSGFELDTVGIIVPVTDGSETRLDSRTLYINMADSPSRVLEALQEKEEEDENNFSEVATNRDLAAGEVAADEEKEETINPELSEVRAKYIEKYKALEDKIKKIGKDAGEEPRSLISEMEASMAGTHILAVEESVVKEFALKKKISEEDARVIFEGVRSRLEYTDAKKALGQKLFNAKRNQLSLTLSGEELKAALGEYKAGEIFNKLVIEEAEALQKKKVETWPPQKKSLFKVLTESSIELGVKWLSLYSRQGRITKFIISSAVIGGIGLSSGYIAGIGGAAMFLAGRIPRYAMSVLGAGAVNKYVAPRIDAKTEKNYQSNIHETKNDFDLENIAKAEERYLRIVKQHKKDKIIDAAEKMILMSMAGVGLGVLGRAFESAAEAAVGSPVFPVHAPEQWVKDHESEANIARRMVIEKELSRPSVKLEEAHGGGGDHVEAQGHQFVEVNKGGNDSVWKMTERQMKAHYGDQWSKMNSAQKTYVLDALKDKMGDSASDKIVDGAKIDFEKFLGKKEEMEKLFAATEKLTKAQVKSIELHDRALDEWVKTHRGEALTQAKADEIIERIGRPSPPEDLPVGRPLSSILVSKETLPGDALHSNLEEVPKEYYDPDHAPENPGITSENEPPKEYYDPDAKASDATTEAEAPKEYYESAESSVDQVPRSPYPVHSSGAFKPGDAPGPAYEVYKGYDAEISRSISGNAPKPAYEVYKGYDVEMSKLLPKSLVEMQKGDLETGEFSSIRDISVKEFMEKVPSNHDLEENPALAEKIDKGLLEAKAKGADGIERSFKVTRNHVGTRDFMEGMRNQLAHRRISYASMGKFTELLKRNISLT